MKNLIALLAMGAAALVPAVASDGGTTGESASTGAAATVVSIEDGDHRMELALDCLNADREGGTERVLRIFRSTGFSLTKVTVRETKRDAAVIRFGFEFTNPDSVKTVYWEADCPSGPTEDRLASR
jgi:acetolactate synthase regulatory subunit